MTETPGTYHKANGTPFNQTKPPLNNHTSLVQQKPSFESQLDSLPPDVKSVAESLALRDMDSAKRYVAQYLSVNRGRS